MSREPNYALPALTLEKYLTEGLAPCGKYETRDALHTVSLSLRGYSRPGNAEILVQLRGRDRLPYGRKTLRGHPLMLLPVDCDRLTFLHMLLHTYDQNISEDAREASETYMVRKLGSSSMVLNSSQSAAAWVQHYHMSGPMYHSSWYCAAALCVDMDTDQELGTTMLQGQIICS